MSRARKPVRKPDAGSIAHDEPVASPEVEARVAGLVARSAAVRWTRKEAEAQEMVVAELMVQGASCKQIHRIMRNDQRRPELSTVGFPRVQKLYARVKERWAQEEQEARSTFKAAARQRIHQARAWAMGERDAKGNWVKRPDHSAIAAYERLLMMIEGTAAPLAITVDATYTRAMLQVTAQLTGEQATELLEAAREQQRLANQARALLPAITVEAEAASG